MENKTENKKGFGAWYFKAGTVISRLLLGSTFIFSGFSKAIDPTGSAIKFSEYFHSFGLESLVFLAMPGSVLLAAIEFLIGANLLLGNSWRKNCYAALIIMLFMTPLTLYLAIANPVSDCGCFGDALHLTNWETFFKNVILLSAALYLVRVKSLIFHIYSRSFQWFISTLIFLFSLLISLISLNHVPLIDFRAYKVGTNIAEGMQIPEGVKGDEYETIFIYEKTGKQQEFTLENYPANDSTWKFVDSKSKLIKKGYTPPIHDLVLLDENGTDILQDILQDTSYMFLLIAPDLRVADDANIDKINDLYDYCLDHGYPFYGVTSSTNTPVYEWRDNTGAEYPFLLSDETTLKTIIRPNPGLMIIKNGNIIAKWNAADIASEEEIAQLLANPQEFEQKARSYYRFVWVLIILFIALLLFLLITEKSVGALINRFFYKRRKNENLTTDTINLHTKKEIIMRRKIVAGNWKMNKTLQEGMELAKELKAALEGKTVNCDVVIGTPFIHLASVSAEVEGSVINVSAQNCADKTSGAYTGEVSASMVASTGAKYVILGHSERRAYYGETTEMLKEKTLLTLANNLTPIFCIGEVLEEREAEKHFEVVKQQIEESLFNLSAEDFGKIVLAYEPVWAIGTGKTASPAQAQEIHAFIRKTVAEKYGQEVADKTAILYGGSCNGGNAKELFANPDVDGGLIGGASLTVDAFMQIITAC
ncbi:MAG: BT_3928 family protein [Bacteroidales bacterium]